ncbi:MAG: response regulator transcription factor [Acholeplasmatales bacterium]|jgi:two-component system response regulator CssR|nr:response regulator transcription factor [Acholeplasmataceae bacterium]MDY0115153.1 response regulator transcription factor [Acholeplasmatales bacterium]MCK9289672.1 response regulator transcription factor [Acholeplasmataceae bacterium]MCK9427463.1 response regulator transcription factor [Acholeplasmataceae bacterium]MDD4090155.1 response regulator transcription factor [Acholeplasmataceae bacterium]
MKIYLVEDEFDLAQIVKKYLEKEDYQVTIFSNGEEALKHLTDEVDLWILDIMLPGDVNGYDLIKAIKEKRPEQAIIFASARDHEIDKIRGLELGSDDYIAKPYSPRELVLRVKAVLKRIVTTTSGVVVRYEGYEINLEKRSIRFQERHIKLTHKEFDLLVLLIENKNTPFSRENILRKVWGNDYLGSNRVVDDLLRRVRNKMPHLKIETIYGFGYRLL